VNTSDVWISSVMDRVEYRGIQGLSLDVLGDTSALYPARIWVMVLRKALIFLVCLFVVCLTIFLLINIYNPT